MLCLSTFIFHQPIMLTCCDKVSKVQWLLLLLA